MTLRIALVIALVPTMVASTRPSAAQCLGDFNGDSKVTIDELITAVNNSLDNCQLQGPRFVDNGNDTVTDHKTGLVWEKKDNLDGSIDASNAHDADNIYRLSTSGTPPDGSAFTDFLFALNGGTSPDGSLTSGCFAGRCDWRLPTIEELMGIADATQGLCAGGSGSGPCVDPALGPTQADGYWSTTAFSRNPTTAWLVDFSSADGAHGAKTLDFFVRAVRGGS